MEEEFDYEVMVVLPDGNEEFTTVLCLDELAAAEIALDEFPEGTTIKNVVKM